MDHQQPIERAWAALPGGARAALEEQCAGLRAGGLPCGSAIVDSAGTVVARGRNHAYDPAGSLDTRFQYPLQHNRLAHAELNALANLPTEADHGALTLWTTQHPCAMCAAAIAFVGIGAVCYVADDPSDHAPPAQIAATRAGVPYEALDEPLWWTIANVFFLYNSAVDRGADAGNLRDNRDRYPALVALTLNLAATDVIGTAARAGATLPEALAPHYAGLLHVVADAPRTS
jgi:tRNA(Arg) A34 adenosine deaminase TadA